MKAINIIKQYEKSRTWEEKSGFLYFLSTIRKKVNSFNETFEFNIQYLENLPSDIDNNDQVTRKVGFVLIRKNPFIPNTTYCLYSVLTGKELKGYVGLYKDGHIDTLKELKTIKDFTKGQATLYDWLRQLVRVSCEKLTL
jgi:hypothetical protein